MKINGVSYNVTVTGHGEPLLLLHGFTGSAADWDSHVHWLSGYYSVILIDLLGHGSTDAPTDPTRYEMRRATADLLAILMACGVETPHLLGYSMGGRLALHFALSHPVRSLMLESASPGLPDSERAARKSSDDALAVRIEQGGIAEFVNYWETLPLFASQTALPEDVRTRQRQNRLMNSAQGLANSLRGMGTGVQPNLWNRLSALDAPTLLLCGALDEKFVGIGREMAKKMRNARLTIIPDAGHNIHLEQPTRFREEVLRFARDSARRRMT